jgi:hypothetical protein
MRQLVESELHFVKDAVAFLVGHHFCVIVMARCYSFVNKEASNNGDYCRNEHRPDRNPNNAAKGKTTPR